MPISPPTPFKKWQEQKQKGMVCKCLSQVTKRHLEAMNKMVNLFQRQTAMAAMVWKTKKKGNFKRYLIGK